MDSPRNLVAPLHAPVVGDRREEVRDPVAERRQRPLVDVREAAFRRDRRLERRVDRHSSGGSRRPHSDRHDRARRRDGRLDFREADRRRLNWTRSEDGRRRSPVGRVRRRGDRNPRRAGWNV